MQLRGVRRVGHRRQHVALQPGRLGEHRQRLVGVGGDDDRVVRRDLAVAVGDLHAVRGLEHRGDLGAEADVGQPGADPADVLAGAAGHGAPLRRPEDAEHPVVLQEREEVAGRVVQRQVGVRGPHRGDQRLHEVPLEVRREAAAGQEVAQRLVGVAAGRVLGRLEQRPGPPVEARDLHQHPEVRRSRQVAAGGKEAARPQRAGVLQTRADVPHGHRHLGLLGLHAELGEEAQQHRVGALVVHDEPGVDRQVLALGGRRRACRRGRRGARRPRTASRARCARRHGRPPGRPHHSPRPRSGAFTPPRARTGRSGAEVGLSEPPSGSTVMPTAVAPLASPSRRTVWSASSGISPAGTITPSFCSQSS